MTRLLTLIVSLVCLAACGGGDDSSKGASTGGAGGTAGAAGAAGAAGSGGAAGGAGSSGSAGSTGAPKPDPQYLPKPTGSCPDFVEGTISVSPAGIPPRDVQVWISDAAKSLDGPLIFYWHGTGSLPLEALYGIGTSQVDELKKQGGIVVAPFHDAAAGTFPWYLTIGSGKEDDLLVADEVLACALEKVGVDTRRIHSMGMSAGGLQTVQLGYRRSGYIASVAPYSGGLLGSPPDQNPANEYAAMIFHGGTSDVVAGVSFQKISEAYLNDLTGAGHFAFICNHGGGHKVPTDASQSVADFLAAHPYGTTPSPYAGGLPSGFPSYCALP